MRSSLHVRFFLMCLAAAATSMDAQRAAESRNMVPVRPLRYMGTVPMD